MIVEVRDDWVEGFFKKEFVEGLKQVQGQPDEVISAYCTAGYANMPIPTKLRIEIAKDAFMKRCIYNAENAPNHNCDGRIEWEHAFIYKKQIQERWAILPCCESHNRGAGMVKSYNQYRALLRAKELGVWDKIKEKYPRFNWDQQFLYLSKKYEKTN